VDHSVFKNGSRLPSCIAEKATLSANWPYINFYTVFVQCVSLCVCVVAALSKLALPFPGPGILAKAAFKAGAKRGRNGRGAIYIWASGNGGQNKDSCSCDGYINNIYTIGMSRLICGRKFANELY